MALHSPPTHRGEPLPSSLPRILEKPHSLSIRDLHVPIALHSLHLPGRTVLTASVCSRLILERPGSNIENRDKQNNTRGLRQLTPIIFCKRGRIRRAWTPYLCQQGGRRLMAVGVTAPRALTLLGKKETWC